MNKAVKTYRQGEVYICYKDIPSEYADKIPAKGSNVTVSRGSTTDHTHVLTNARLHKVNDHTYVGKLGKNARITTGESGRHEDIKLPPGEVEVRMQLEWDGGEAARLAAD